MMKFLFEMSLELAPKSSREVSSTLYRQLKAGILEGKLKAGTRLPSTRSAQSVFSVSRNTAQQVYDQLAQEGLLIARHGSGTFVSDQLDSRLQIQSEAITGEPDPRLNSFWLSTQAKASTGFWREREEHPQIGGERIDLRPALIDPALFPSAIFRQVMARQLRRLENRPPSFKSPQGNRGNFQLRRAIADHIALTRAVSCQPEDVLVTSGAQQAFDLIARALVKPRETLVVIEDPGYPPMRVPFLAAGARLVQVRVDDEGLVVDEIPPDAKIICVCPSHQFPLGMSMSPRRRQELVQFAARNGAVIVEDDYDGEFRYDGSPLEALRTTDSSSQVFYVGSFSKCMLPSLRLGFVVPPIWAMETLVAVKNSLDWHCSVPVQLAVAAFIAEGHLARHVRRLRGLYRERRNLVVEIINQQLPGSLEAINSTYGMHVAAIASQDVDCEAVSRALDKRGVKIHALDRYYFGNVTHPGFVLGYGAADTQALRKALNALIQEVQA